LALDAIFSVDDVRPVGVHGVRSARVAAERQRDIILPFELAHLFLWPKPDGEPKVIVHTAHEVKTAKEAFRRLKRVVTSSPVLMGELLGGERGIKDNNQERGFELANGNRLLFLARSKNSGVGFTVDVLVVDEAQQTPQASMDALLPTMSAVENTQVLFTGTVPDELNDAEYWEGVRDRGRSKSDPRTGWMEFNPPGSDDPDSRRDRRSRRGELAVVESGLRIPEGSEPEDDRGRDQPAHSGGGPSAPVLGVAESSPACGSSAVRTRPHAVRQNLERYPGAQLGDGAVIAIAVSRDGGSATVGVASPYDDEVVYFEHKHSARGTRWVAQYVKDLKRELGDALVVLDPKNAAVILTDLASKRVKPLAMSMDEVAAAHALFIEYSNDGMLAHRGQAEVRKSFQFATTRPIGRAGVTWEASDPSKPISIAQAVTWAVWGVKKDGANPRKKRTHGAAFSS
jgi:hypothetical protein